MWYDDVRRIIYRSSTTSGRTSDGKVQVNEQNSFKGLPLTTHHEINAIVEAENKENFKRISGSKFATLDEVSERSSKKMPEVMNSVHGPASLIERVGDAIGYRDMFTSNTVRGGISNNSWNSGVYGKDPSLNNSLSHNIYITPMEASAIYGQNGLPTRIINKKSKSLLLNGVRLVNSRLSVKQLEAVQERMIATDFLKAVSDSIRDSLTFAGALLFPMFNNDAPLSLTLPIQTLLNYGVIKKDCITRWITLDRWNTVHYPNWNPTAEDFRKPKYFYVPFLGVDVHSSRTARIVTAPQPGYWGALMNMGWGASDIPGWIESVYNYYNVMHSIPTMVNQMSLLVRTFNVDGPLALEGAMILDQVSDEETLRVREASPLNPINMDVVGELKAVQRDFGQVPELVRLIRQDVAAKAGLLEQALFTVDPKGMGGGAGTQQPWTTQEETNRFAYTDIQQQLRSLAKIQIIDALGTDKEVLDALPFTEVKFDSQKITEIEDRIKVVSAITKGFFDSSAGGMPIQDAAELMEQLSGGTFSIDSELYDRLEARQKVIDRREEEKHEAEIKALKVTSDDAHSEGHSYEDPLEQRSKEKVSKPGIGTQKQGIAKASGKKVGAT